MSDLLVPDELQDLVARLAASSSPDAVVVALRNDQVARHRQSMPLPAEAYLRAFPEVAARRDDALVIVCGEMLLRMQAGDHTALADLQQRFPHFAGDLALQHELQQMLTLADGEATRTALPVDPFSSAEAFLTVLREKGLLSAEQLAELAGSGHEEALALAGDLIRRGWLKPYQVNRIKQGHADELVLGPYLLLDRLGEGGMGQVFRARHSRLGTIVAVKRIRKELMANEDAVRRFLREVRATSKLSHPNVVRALDADCDGETYFLVMEYVDGHDLASLVREKGPLPVLEACECIRQAGLGLQHAFEHGLVHRDVKPHNLIRERATGRVKLADLGLVRFTAADGEVSTTLTEQDSVMGTPDFLAPEQATSARNADVRSDLYALGCTLYFLLTRQVPFPGGTILEKLSRHRFERPQPVGELREEVPASVRGIVAKLMAKDPAGRHQTPADLVADLDVALAGGELDLPEEPDATQTLPNSTPPADIPLATPVHPVQQRRRKRTPPAVIAAGVALLLVAAAAGMWVFLANKPQPPPVVTPPLPGPLGQLRRKDLTAVALRLYEGKNAETDGLVGVLGDARFRHWGPLRALAFDAAGKRLASADALGSVRVWERDGTPVFVQPSKHDKINAMALSADGFLTFGEGGGKVTRWRIAPLEVSKPPDAGADLVLLALTADGRLAAFGAPDGSVRVQAVEGGSVQKRTGPGGILLAGAFSGSGERLAIADKQGRIHVHDLNGRGEPLSLSLSAEKLKLARGRLSLSGDGSRLGFVTTNLATVGWWDLSPAVKRLPITVDFPGTDVLVTPREDGRLALVSSGLSLWHGTRRNILLGANALSLYVVNLSPGRKWLAAGGEQHAVRCFELPSGEELPSGDAHFGPLISLAAGPKASFIATGGRDMTARIWPMPAGKPAVLPHASFVVGLGVAGGRLVTAAHTGEVAVWDEANRKKEILRPAKDTRTRVHALAVSSDGRLAAVAAEEGDVEVYEVQNLKRVASFRAAGKKITALAWHPDGRRLAAGGADGVRVWDAAGKPAEGFVPSPMDVAALAFSPDGKTLVAGAGNDLLVWRGDGTAPKVQTGRHAGRITSLAFSPEGGRLASVNAGGRMFLRDATSWVEVRSWEFPPGLTAGMRVAFADARHLVTGNCDGTAYVFRLP